MELCVFCIVEKRKEVKTRNKFMPLLKTSVDSIILNVCSGDCLINWFSFERFIPVLFLETIDVTIWNEAQVTVY